MCRNMYDVVRGKQDDRLIVFSTCGHCKECKEAGMKEDDIAEPTPNGKMRLARYEALFHFIKAWPH